MYEFGTTPSEPQGFLIGPMPAVLATPALAIRREKSITEKYNSSWGIGLRRGMAGRVAVRQRGAMIGPMPAVLHGSCGNPVRVPRRSKSRR